MRKAILLFLLIVVAVGAGLWWHLDRQPRVPGAPHPGAQLVPEFLRSEDPGRLFCAESPETGVCRCITASGERPEIPESECRRRARQSESDSP